MKTIWKFVLKLCDEQEWHFSAAVEPTVRRWRVVSADGRTEMPFHLEAQARAYAAKHGGRVEKRVARPFKLQEAR